MSVSSRSFYGEYYGHPVSDLQVVLEHLRGSSESLIWTAGDSTLDNKYWLSDSLPAAAQYSNILHPPLSKPDVTYWLNKLAPPNVAAINTAVEATTLNERTFRLRPQDVFLRDNIQPQDTLIVSVGGNDVALSPQPCTILSMLGLMKCTPKACIDSGCTCGTVPCDDCCCGCGPSTCSCCCAYPPCLGYFRHLFGTRVKKYIGRLTSQTKPAQIVVCVVYYPDERPSPGWAGPALSLLGYNQHPEQLQSLIRKAYAEISSLPGSQVVPLFHVLNGKNTEDYVERVEPSSSGGRKMAEFLLDRLQSPGLSTELPATFRIGRE